MAVVGSIHPLAARARAQARREPSRAGCRNGDQERARRLHAAQRRRVDLGHALGGHRRVEPRRQGGAVRARQQQGLSASDVLPDARRSEAPVMSRDEALFDYLLRLGDTVGKGPIVEEDMASTDVGLDLLGQARLWLSYAGEVEARLRGAGRDEDQLAFRRDAGEFRNLLLVERPNGSYADTIARQFLF